MMNDSRPEYGPRDAERIAGEVFGVAATAAELPAELDRNFLLEAAGGRRMVLKISPADAAPSEIEAQVAALCFLEGGDLGRHLPMAVPATDGRRLVRVPGPPQDGCWVRLYSYLDGHKLVDLGERSPRLLEDLGRFLARLDRALLGFDHPGARRKIPWDLTRLPELAPALAAVDDTARRDTATRIMDSYRRRVAPALPELRRSVIHNDANDHNVLVSSLDPMTARIAGLIDFGDMVYTSTVAELAIACAYVMIDAGDPLAAAARVVAGYHAELPLTPPERALLFDLITARLCQSVLMAAGRRHREAGNEYLFVSEDPVWRLLERLTMIDPENAAEQLADRCLKFPAGVRSPQEIVAVRRRHLGRNLSVAYREPLKIVRGEGQYLFDEDGRRYLDLVNNVCHVGHCHPRVVAAARRQMGVLNTNTRYLHDNLAEYALRLTATLPEPLSVCFFVCTGTEANDLALRLARAHAGSTEIVVLDHAYHGHSPSLVEISPYKCEGPGGEGLAPHARKVPMPDVYRGPYRGADAGARYAHEVAEAVAAWRHPGAFLAESLIGCGGQIVPPPGFFAAAYGAVRAAGGVCIADEVQVGFGRVGRHMWAFELHGVVPDIVTLGKPIGNGHPLAAVVTTPEIAASFDTGMEYFNTFGGNPVSCAVGLAVLDVLVEERLQAHALAMGERLMDGLRAIQENHPIVGDVRGEGLFIGVELVRDPQTLESADGDAAEVIERMKDRGFLISTDGPLHNVLKIKPPLVLQPDDVDGVLAVLAAVLTGLG